MTLTAWHVYREAIRQRADLYHFHDPELIPVGLLLRAQGKRVVYDMHEHVPHDILGKDYLPRALRQPVALAMDRLERASSRLFSGLVAATPAIAQRFTNLDGKLAVVQNFPAREELDARVTMPWAARQMSVAYAGLISRDRGIAQMTDAMSLVSQSLRAKLLLAGNYDPLRLRSVAQARPGWKHVVELGFVSRDQLREVLGEVRAGLVVFHPDPNNVRAQPNKLFEYMAAGLPVIASNFPLWKEIVCGVNCGIVVDPLAPREIADAIEYLLTHPSEAEAMGLRGRRAVRERYQWDTEKDKLLRLYERLALKPCAA